MKKVFLGLSKQELADLRAIHKSGKLTPNDANKPSNDTHRARASNDTSKAYINAIRG